MSSKSAYIPHITGLRGLAILLVMLYHFQVPGFEHVFTGVDVILVVSGFLMTGSLISEYSRSIDPDTRIGRFSLKNFYLRRARRLLPASTIVIIFILIFSWFFNNQARFSQVLNDGIWAAFSATNLNFAVAATNYFSFDQEQSPFLHFWSLAVQEQFYFVWPPLMLAALAFRGLRLRGVLVSWQQRLRLLFWGTTIVSMLAMAILFYFQPTVTYFLTLTRVWELSLGAVLAVELRNEHSFIHRLPGWVKQLPIPLFAISLFVIRENNFGYTMPIVSIACLLMVAKGGNNKDWDIRFLSSKPMEFLGERSYSLYLWHWPMLVFSKELGFPQTFEAKLALLAISIGVAVVSYRYIEVSFQKITIPEFKVYSLEPIPKVKWVAGSATLVATILLIPSIVVQPVTQVAIASMIPKSQFVPIDPTPSPTDEEFNQSDEKGWLLARQAEISASNFAIKKAGKLSAKQISEINRTAGGLTYREGFGFTCSFGACTLGNPTAKTRILIIGSSFALQYAATFAAMAQQGESLFVQMFSGPYCPNASSDEIFSKIENKDAADDCRKLSENVLIHAARNQGFYDYVVLSDRNWIGPEYTRSAVDYANKVKLAGRKTVILGEPPASEDLTSCLDRDYSNYDTCLNTRKSSASDYQVASLANVAFGNISDLFCLDSFCPLLIGNAPTSSQGHLTDASAASIAPYFMAFLEHAKKASN